MNSSNNTLKTDRVTGLKLILRCDAGKDIGLGHIKRCIALAQWLDEKPIFALGEAPEVVANEITATGFEQFHLDGSGAPISSMRADAVVLDIAHSGLRNKRGVLRNHIEDLARSGLPLVFIDGTGIDDTGNDSFVDEALSSKLALSVRPYVGARAESYGKWLAGSEYFIVSPQMAQAAQEKREFRAIAERILVTTGGGDIGALGPRILAELNAVRDQRFDIRVVVGPLVDDLTRREVNAKAARSPHRVSVLETRQDLIEDMRWCEMAVATTGLTKYELALNAVPSILISPDLQHDMNNLRFRQHGTALDLGAQKDLRGGTIAAACCRLSGSMSLRRSLSENGRKLIDGKGALRLLSAIRSLVNAS